MLFTAQTLLYKALMAINKVGFKFVLADKPTVLLGEGSSLKLCGSLTHFDIDKILVVTDRPLVDLGLVAPIQDALEAAGIEVVIYDGVEPDPTFKVINEGLALLKQRQCDAVLAVGGGSSIDAAKVIALAATNQHLVPEKLAGLFKARHRSMPLYAIPTTAGTGSEVTIAAIVSDSDTHEKLPVADVKVVPLMAALDPAIMTGLPPAITAATGMDALTHAIESYLSRFASADTDAYSGAAVRMIFDNLQRAYEHGEDLAAREAMAVASFYAGLAFTRVFVGYVHAIAHQLGSYYGTPHGLANAVVLPHVLQYSADEAGTRLAELAVLIGVGKGDEDEAVLAQKFVDAVVSLNKSLNIPVTLDALRSEDIPTIARGALKEAHYNYAVPKYMNRGSCEAMIAKLLPSAS